MNKEEIYIVVFMLNEKLSEAEAKKFRLLLQALTGEAIEKNTSKADMIELASRKGHLKRMVDYFHFNWQVLVSEFQETYTTEPEAL